LVAAVAAPAAPVPASSSISGVAEVVVPPEVVPPASPVEVSPDSVVVVPSDSSVVAAGSASVPAEPVVLEELAPPP